MYLNKFLYIYILNLIFYTIYVELIGFILNLHLTLISKCILFQMSQPTNCNKCLIQNIAKLLCYISTNCYGYDSKSYHVCTVK